MPKWDVLSPQRPQSRPAADINQVVVLANTDFFTLPFGASGSAGMLTVWVAMDQAGVFRVVYNTAGVVTTLDLNRGASLVANAMYAFDVPLHASGVDPDRVNFQYSVGATILLFRVDETLMDRGVISDATEGEYEVSGL